MRKTKIQKGITLIALIITIIILLILAVVTIGSIKKSNIITYAQNASSDYNTKKNQEEDILSDYESMIKENLPGGDEVTNIDEEVPIPEGFKFVEGKKETGLVIENETEGSQFVWVPVDNINDMVMCQICGGNGNLDKETLQCLEHGANTKLAGKLYATSVGANFNSRLTNQTYNESSGHSEPTIVTKVYNSAGADMDSTYLKKAGLTTDLTGDKEINELDFKYQLQSEFDEIAKSVAKYGGFYVGRYETSINGTNNPQSKYGATSATSESLDTWYGLYALNKKYTTNSVKSSMLWGSQYDAMMKWMGDVANQSNEDKANKSRVCGTEPKDVINNVYDLYGNSYECTLEASDDTIRVYRGGSLPSCRGMIFPTFGFALEGSRLALYIV